VLGDRRIDDAFRPEFLQQALGDLVGALILGDFLAHHEDVLVGAQFFGHRFVERLAHGHFDHFNAGRQVRIARDLQFGCSDDGCRLGSGRRRLGFNH
jgi:hypothetical protein